ncbi:hypothetical protein H4W81_000394 [Nonomuraea africana]|uniref:Uncharacterized protein n=1 Tax=Nonomuraea africana TaxID=46171 RepID=A0ABR9K6I1_9ACTN|nr:hypothetical protein [Nonomuraea africana]
MPLTGAADAASLPAPDAPWRDARTWLMRG